MEETVKAMAEKPEDVNESFRLYLSSMPAKHFPVSVNSLISDHAIPI